MERRFTSAVFVLLCRCRCKSEVFAACVQLAHVGRCFIGVDHTWLSLAIFEDVFVTTLFCDMNDRWKQEIINTFTLSD